MASNAAAAHILRSILDSIKPDELPDETIEKLQALLPENLILSAFDLVDREKVIQYVTPWGSKFYQVLGSTATYSVYVDMIVASIPYYCTCPAFAHAVLLSDTHVVCKHILATYVARQLSQCLNRSVALDEFQHVIGRQFGSDGNFDES